MSVLKLASARLVADSAACKRASLAALEIEGGPAGGRSVFPARWIPVALAGSPASGKLGSVAAIFEFVARDEEQGNRTPSFRVSA
jgi:hypothetical protein